MAGQMRVALPRLAASSQARPPLKRQWVRIPSVSHGRKVGGFAQGPHRREVCG